MGGKSYFCDYCRCYLKNDIRVRKTHNSGLMHNIAKVNYMRRYEDPRKILQEESAKVPCSRFPRGYCKFGLFCQYTHYSANQLKELKEIVKKLEQQPSIGSKYPNRKVKQGQTYQDTNKKWKRMKNRGFKYKNLPPSLRETNCRTVKSETFLCEWG